MVFFLLSWNLLLYMPTIDMLVAHPRLFSWGSSNRDTQEQKQSRDPGLFQGNSMWKDPEVGKNFE